MNILITGSKGQLGLEIQKIVSNSKIKKNAYYFVSHDDVDIINKESVQKVVNEKNIDIIVNCAAFTDFNKCPYNIELAEDVNGTGPMVLAEVLKERDGILIHVSSDYVFDGTKKIGKYKPQNRPNPISVYGKTKVMGEENIAKCNGNYLIFRVSWLYGGDRKNFVDTVFKLIETKEEISIVNDQIGSPTYVTDFAEFLVYVLETFGVNDLKKKKGIYHFSNNGKVTWYDVTKQVYKIRKKVDKGFVNKCKIIPIKTDEFPSNDKRPKYSPLDTKKTVKVFNYKTRKWKDALYSCVVKYVNNIKENGKEF